MVKNQHTSQSDQTFVLASSFLLQFFSTLHIHREPEFLFQKISNFPLF